MSALKDLVDLVTQLNDGVQDRKFASELREIQRMISAIQSEHVELHDQRITLTTENAELKQQIASLTQNIASMQKAGTASDMTQLNEVAEQILKILFDAGRELTVQEIAASISLNISTTEYHIDNLLKHNCVGPTKSDYDVMTGESFVFYSLDRKGRAYVVERLNNK